MWDLRKALLMDYGVSTIACTRNEQDFYLFRLRENRHCLHGELALMFRNRRYECRADRFLYLRH
jgi:hypothetical protein